MSIIHRLASRIFGWGAGAALALMFVIVFVNSLRRYTIGKSFEWGEELPIYLTIYGVMFGIGLAYLDDRHVRFSILTDLFPSSIRRRIFAGVDLITIAIGAVVAWSGTVFAMRRGGLEASGLIGSSRALAETSGVEWLAYLGHMGSWQAAIAVGGGILSIAAAIRFMTRLQEP